MTSAITAVIVTAFCPGVKDLKASVIRRTGAGRRSVMSGLHPHDLLEGIQGLVPYGQRELQPEGGLVGRHRVLRRVLQRAVGRLAGEVVGLLLGRLDVLQSFGEHAGEVVVRALRRTRAGAV